MGYLTNAMRNFFSYVKEFGWKGAIQIGLNNRRATLQRSIKIDRYPFPIYYRKGTTDFAIMRQLIGRELLFKEIVTPKLIIDAGANAGYASVFYASRFANARIVSIEMENSNFMVLEKNIAGYPNVKPIKAALWNHANGVSFGENKSKDSYNLFDGGEAVQKVNSITLSDILINDEVIDILKLDIEGAEVEVLDFMQGKNIQPHVLVVELHDRFRSNCTLALNRYLDGRQYHHQKIHEYDVYQFT